MDFVRKHGFKIAVLALMRGNGTLFVFIVSKGSGTQAG